MKTITAHCLVKNEARFIWYSIMSVIEHVDKVLLWDTGSTDGTKEIIKQILKIDKKEKITYVNYGDVTTETFWEARQNMLDETKTDWFLVVDGDEVWWNGSIAEVISTIRKEGTPLESIVVPTYNLVGDIFHYLPESAGFYKFTHMTGEVFGHFNLRAVNRKIPGLRSFGRHGTWGWVDQDGAQIQDRGRDKRLFLDAPYIHATFLERASNRMLEYKVPKRSKKLKHEIGVGFPYDFYYPEVFFKPRPDLVPSVWRLVSTKYKIRSRIETPFKKMKRAIFPHKVGY